MVGIAQLVRAPDCGSGGRGFEFHYSPQKIIQTKIVWIIFFLNSRRIYYIYENFLNIYETFYILIMSNVLGNKQISY